MPSPAIARPRGTWLAEALLLAVIPLVGLLLLTGVFRFSAADVAMCRWFYAGESRGWPYTEAEPWLTLYRFGPLPGIMLGLGGALVVIGSFFWAALRRWREMGLFLALLLAVGPGLAVNGIFKPHWSRPRPNQIRDFGGSETFIGVWSVGPNGASKSFPSGHASMGFYLMGPAFLLYRRRPRWALFFLLLGLAGGGVLGLARVAQGQHFPSDVLWSGGLVYLSGLVLGYLFHLSSAGAARDVEPSVRPVILSLDAARSLELSQQREVREADRRAA